MGTCCATTANCQREKITERTFARVSDINTLAFDAAACIHCGMCYQVCPHGVFVLADRRMRVARAEACMECGACMLNCPVGALQVDSGVGCAAALIYAALTGKAETCCGDPEVESSQVRGCC